MAAASPGLLDSLRRLLDTALGLAQARLQLFGSELEEEKLRLFDVLWLAALALLLLGLALVLLLGFVVLLFWDPYRLPAVGVLTLVLGGGGVWLLLRARSLLQASDGGPFALSLAELRRDRDALSPPEQP